MVGTRAVLLAGLALGAAALPGCRKEEAAPAARIEDEGEVVAITRTFPASTSGGLRAETKAVVKDGKAWEEIWAKANGHLAPVPKAPTVDFGKEMVAVYGCGERKTGGWSAEVVGARRVEGRLRILYAVRAPAKDAATAQAVTMPWHAVVLPRSEEPVEWAEYKPMTEYVPPKKKEKE